LGNRNSQYKINQLRSKIVKTSNPNKDRGFPLKELKMKNAFLTAQKVNVSDLGLIGYDEAYDIQKTAVERVIKGADPQIFLCEHPNVLTKGRMTKESSFLLSEKSIQECGTLIRPIDRGGDVTLHAPGQVVLYPILDLSYYGKSLKSYLRRLEAVIIKALADFKIMGCTKDGQTGVWAGDRKIASIGIGVRKWVSYHGLSVNVSNDLSLYDVIKPCGLDVMMSSIAQENKPEVSVKDFKNLLIEKFCEEFELER